MRLRIRRNRVIPARLAMLAGVVAIVLAATFLRQTGVPKADTIWAEDGRIFAQCAYDETLPACLLTPYEGYLHTVPRLAVVLAPLGDPASLPFRLTLTAGLLAAIAAALAALAVADATSSPAAGLLAGASLVLGYSAGLEVSGNLTNVHWILFAASATVIVTSWVGRPPRPPDLILVAGTAVTSVFGPLLVALAVVAVVRRTPGARRMLAVVLTASAIQVIAMLVAVRSPVLRPPLTPWQFLVGTWRMAVDAGVFGQGHIPWNVGVWVLLAMLTLALALVGRERWGWPARAISVAAVVALPASGLVVFGTTILVNHSIRQGRYGYEPTSLAVVAIALAGGLLADRLSGRRPFARLRLPGPIGRMTAGSVLIGTILVLFGIGFGSTFYARSYASNGPDATAEIRRAAPRCMTGTRAVEVLVSPGRAPWYVDIPCMEFDAAR